MGWLCGHAISVSDVYHKDMHQCTYTEIYKIIQKLVVTENINNKNEPWDQPNVHIGIDYKMWYIHTLGYYKAVKTNKPNLVI